MPKEPSVLPEGLRPTDILTATQFAAVFPPDEIRKVLEEHDKATQRDRILPNVFVVYFVMMLALFRSCNHREVFRIIAMAFLQMRKDRRKKNPNIPTPAALSKARSRVGDAVLEKIFNSLAFALGTATTPGCFFKKWQIMAIDGCVLDLEDTVENRKEFGSSSNQHKKAGPPQIRFVGLMEVGTHLFVQAAMGGYFVGEVTLAKQILHRLSSGMILLCDRNFFSFDFFETVSNQGAAILCRIQKGMKFQPQEYLEDGSILVEIFSSKDTRKENGKLVRLVQYRAHGMKSGENIFLLTNILNPAQASAYELARLYHERWEYENALDELKTHLSESAVTLRSKTPALVRQELWGTLMTHHVVRSVMFRAASQEDLDPDRLSFTHSVKVIGRTLIKSTSDFPPSG